MTSRFTQFDDKIYCYNAKYAHRYWDKKNLTNLFNSRTSYLLSENGGVFENDGIININEFTYTRSDGEVYSFIPKELQGGLNVSEPSSVESSSAGASETTRSATTSTTVVSSTDAVSLSETATQTFGNTTTGAVTATAPLATESGSVGSKVDTKVGVLSFLAAIGSLAFAGLGAFMVL